MKRMFNLEEILKQTSTKSVKELPTYLVVVGLCSRCCRKSRRGRKKPVS